MLIKSYQGRHEEKAEQDTLPQTSGHFTAFSREKFKIFLVWEIENNILVLAQETHRDLISTFVESTLCQ